MKLFERVKLLSKEVAPSTAAIARDIGIHERTFQNYLKETREDNLWPLLPKILESFPQIRRDWLYFDEGEMLKSEQQGPEISVAAMPAQQEIDVQTLLARLEAVEKRLEGVSDDDESPLAGIQAESVARGVRRDGN